MQVVSNPYRNNSLGQNLTSKNSVQNVRINYVYGFQNQEMDDEIKGEGNSINYTFRMHDPRIGRFFAVDPLIKKYPSYSSYSFSGNKVINCIELEGAEEFIAVGIPSTAVTLSNVLPANVATAMVGVPPSQNNNLTIGPVAPSNTGQEVNVTVMSVKLIWDPTARSRPGEAGMISYVGVTGIGTGMRALTQEESRNSFIATAIGIQTDTPLFEEKRSDARATTISSNVGTNNVVMSQSPYNNQNAEVLQNISIYTPAIVLNTVFTPDTSNPPATGITQADRLAIARIASTLNNNPSASVNLSGNSSAPAGSTPATMNGNAGITFGQLTLNRANVYANILSSAPFNVNPSQINTNTGNVTLGTTNVTATLNGQGGTPPNNGNVINYLR